MASEFSAATNVSIFGDSVQHQGSQDISQDSSRDENSLAHSPPSSDQQWSTDEHEEISSQARNYVDVVFR